MCYALPLLFLFALSLVSTEEFDALSAEHQTTTTTLHTTQQAFETLTKTERDTRRTLEQALLQIGSRDTQLQALHKLNEERTEELNTLQTYLRRKAAEVSCG